MGSFNLPFCGPGDIHSYCSPPPWGIPHVMHLMQLAVHGIEQLSKVSLVNHMGSRTRIVTKNRYISSFLEMFQFNDIYILYKL